MENWNEFYFRTFWIQTLKRHPPLLPPPSSPHCIDQGSRGYRCAGEGGTGGRGPAYARVHGWRPLKTGARSGMLVRCPHSGGKTRPDSEGLKSRTRTGAVHVSAWRHPGGKTAFCRRWGLFCGSQWLWGAFWFRCGSQSRKDNFRLKIKLSRFINLKFQFKVEKGC